MINDLQGKCVLITGSSTGIGAALAKKMSALGARVAVHYNSNEEKAKAVVDAINQAGGDAFSIQGDVANPEEIETLIEVVIERMGRIDILVNNAGTMLGRTHIADADLEQYTNVMDVNARSVYSACHAVIPHMRKQGSGNIINVTSIAARTGGGGGAGLYGSAKAFVSTLTRVIAKEEAPNNIRVNGVAPGVITTAFHERYSNEQQLEDARKTIPMGRLGTAEDCVGAFLFLASDELSAYITGQVIEVNGGQLMP